VETLCPPSQPQGPLTAENHIVNAQGEFLIKFPPFPQAPQGVEIMPFKRFKERGIRVDPGPDDAEVDALGIPTVPMKTHHKTDVCKSNIKRKRKSDDKEERKRQGLPPKKLTWYEEWEETEAIRFSYGFDPCVFRLLHKSHNICSDIAAALATRPALNVYKLRQMISPLGVSGLHISCRRRVPSSFGKRFVLLLLCYLRILY